MKVNQSKKKILFLITKSNWGGAQRYVFDLATSLDPNRYEPVVALGGNGKLYEKLQAANIRCISLQAAQRDISITKEIRLGIELWRILRAERPHVLHVNSSKIGGLGCFIGRVARVPRIIFTAHGWAFNENRPGWQKVVIKFLHWFTVLLSHHTIAVSNALITQMDWFGIQHKMTVINPGRTILDFASKIDARRIITTNHPPLAPHQGDVWIMIIAELHPIKQHKVLFDAMQQVVKEYPNVRLICIGDGQLRTSLSQYITELGLEKHVFLTGSIHEAAKVLKAADVFVLPSQSESYGYVLHEAGLADVPIIASDVGGIRDIVSNQSGTLVDSGDTAQLKKAITDHIQHPEIHKDKTSQLHKQLQTRTVEAMTDETITVYESNTIESSD